MTALTSNVSMLSPLARIETASFFVIRQKHWHEKDTVESWIKLLIREQNFKCH